MASGSERQHDRHDVDQHRAPGGLDGAIVDALGHDGEVADEADRVEERRREAQAAASNSEVLARATAFGCSS
jgi:hypothetical protein